jgi:RNA polymerase primary sigma factor
MSEYKDLYEIARRTPPINYRMSRKYIIDARNGDSSARQKVAEGNLRLVMYIANEMRNITSVFSWDDLFQMGVIGLMKAIDKFDVSKSTKFSNYAGEVIRSTIKYEINNLSRLIRVPENKVRTLLKIRKSYSKLQVAYGSAPTHQEIADDLGMDVEEVIKYSEYDKSVSSINAPTGDGTSSIGDYIESDSLSSYDHACQMECRAQLKSVMSSVLDERSNDIVQRRFAIGYPTKQSFEEIGDEYNLTKAGVRAIFLKALKSIKASPDTHKLREFYVA